MRGYFWHVAMKHVVETGDLACRWEKRLRGINERESLRNMQRRKVRSGPQLFDQSRCDPLMLDDSGTAVHDAMSHRHRLRSKAVTHHAWNPTERFLLRF